MEGVEDVEHGEREKEQEDETEGGRRALLAASSGGRLHCPRRFRPSLCSRGIGTSSSSVSSWTAEKVAGGSELIRAGGERKEFGGGGNARDQQVAHSPRALVGAVQVQLLVSVCSSCVTQCFSEAQSTNGARIIASLQLWMKTVRIFIRPSVRPNKYEHLFG